MRDECPEILPNITDSRDHVEYYLRDIRDGCQAALATTANFIFDPSAVKIWFLVHTTISGKVIHMLFRCTCAGDITDVKYLILIPYL